MGMAGCCVLMVRVGVAIILVVSASGDIDFGYSGARGPSKWGSMYGGWRACSVGKQQSPVDIARSSSVMVRKQVKGLERHYNSANASLVNYGFNIAVEFEEDKAGSLLMDGNDFTLKQLHWHTPAEHLIDGLRHPAELHLIHKSQSHHHIAVVALLFNYGTQNKLVQKLENGLRKLAKQVRTSANHKPQVALGDFDTKPLITHPSHTFYKYMGSFTTPPCWENITWVILDKVEQITKHQLHFLKAPLDKTYYNNSRPVQPLNGRKIELYNPSSTTHI